MPIPRPEGPLSLLLSQLPATWDAIDGIVNGDVVGPSSAVNNRIAVFDDTTGKLIKDGGSTIAEIVAGSGGLVTSVFGRTGNITAATNDYTWAQIDKTTSSLADITTRSAGDLSSGTLPDGRFPSTLPAISGANLTNLNASNLASGTVAAARMPALTGDVTSSAGSVSTTIANNAVTLAKLADIATASFLGKNTAGTGDPEVLSIATAKTMLNLAGTNSGDVTLAGENYLSIAAQVLTANPINLSGTNVTATLPVTKGGTGTATAFTTGSIVFAGASGVYSQNNAQLFWNNSTNRLGIGTASPGHALEVFGGSIFINSATANLYMKDTSTGWQSAATTVITPQNNNNIRSTNFTSGLVGWNISALGNAEFSNVDVRGAIHSAIFTYNAINATAGTLGVFKSAAKLRTDVTVPASPTYGTTTVDIDVVDAEGLSHAASQLFVTNDILRLKDGLVGDTWFKVSAVSDQTTFWRYTAIIMAGSNNVTYRAGMAVADYGLSGQGFILQTADQTNAPYLQMATHVSSFTSSDSSGTLIVTPRLRIGNLNGSYGYASNVYGFGTGQYGVASKNWLTVDETNGIRLGTNTTVNGQWDTSGNVVVGPVAAGLNNILLSTSAGLQLRTNTTVVISMGFSGDVRIGQEAAGQSNVLINAGQLDLRNNTTTRIRLASNGSGFLANSNISWDTSGNLTVSGNATIAGWSISSNSLTNSEVKIAAGVDWANTAGTGEAWFGKGSTGMYGVLVKGTTAAHINIVAGHPAIGAAGRPYIQLNDGTRPRVVIGELNTTAWDGSATNSMGMKIWSSAGSLLVHFSDVANSIAGWTISSTKISSTGIDLHSGASAALAFGSTPPTSASAGTGIWLDRTGLYGLASNVAQAQFNATSGKLTGGAGAVILDVDGITIEPGSNKKNKIKWATGFGGSDFLTVFGREVSSAEPIGGLSLLADSGTSGNGTLSLSSTNDNGNTAVVSIRAYGSTHSRANQRNVSIGANNGVILHDGDTHADPSLSASLELASGSKALILNKPTTTQRDALTAVNGMLIYNATTNKFQGRAGGVWVDLH